MRGAFTRISVRTLTPDEPQRGTHGLGGEQAEAVTWADLTEREEYAIDHCEAIVVQDALMCQPQENGQWARSTNPAMCSTKYCHASARSVEIKHRE